MKLLIALSHALLATAAGGFAIVVVLFLGARAAAPRRAKLGEELKSS